MRTLKVALAAVAALAFNNANAQSVTGMGMKGPPTTANDIKALYQPDLRIQNGAASDNLAFHAGGVAACDGCHVMHNASGGVAKSTAGKAGVTPWTNVTNMYLLQGSDQSSTCLICHAGQNMVGQFFVADMTTTVSNAVAPTNRTPGGDFGWIRSESNYDNSIYQRHGHNVAAGDFGLVVDNTFQDNKAPGGTWTNGEGRKAFACSSCHDPHGRYRIQQGATAGSYKFVGPYSEGALPIAASGSYGAEPTAAYAVGSYRLLAGQNYAPASNPAFPFPNDPPIAVAPQTYNASEATSEVRVAYGTGMSEWCQNCHTNIHLDGYTTGVAGLRHPAGSDAFLHAGQYNVYNTYLSSGHVDAAASSKYTSLVPFEQGKNVTLATLKANTSPNSIVQAGPTSSVMCLSCHRAHASAFDSMIRWDQNATFLTDGTTFTAGLTNRDAAVTKAGYYDRSVTAGAGNGSTTLGAYQRSLCNKCHGKD